VYQKITIIGNLGRDPEMRYLPSGQAVTNISVATNRRYTDSNGQKVDETTWFRVSVWGAQAESVNQYLRSINTFNREAKCWLKGDCALTRTQVDRIFGPGMTGAQERILR